MTEILLRPRIGVAGTGWWATQFHIPSLLQYEGVELVAIADSDKVRLAAAANLYGITSTYESAESLIKSGTIDGIVVATTSASHYAICRTALEHGIHVMVEKPMVLHATEAWELVELAKSKHLHLTIGYTFQHTKAAKRVREIIQGGGIGELVHISGLFASMVEAFYRGVPEEYASVFNWPITGPSESTYSNSDNSGGGQAQTQITHAMGMVLYATGQSVVDVSAYMNNRDLQVDLADAIAYRLESGVVGTMASTGNLRPGDPQQQEFRYYGTKGFILHDMVAGTLFARYDNGETEEISGSEVGDPYPAFATARHLADLIAGRDSNRAPSEDAARVVEFLEASYLSAEMHEPVNPMLLREASKKSL
jgi:predicted dehydrogenase